MIDGLGSSLFLCYLEILQSLKRKVSDLVDLNIHQKRRENHQYLLCTGRFPASTSQILIILQVPSLVDRMLLLDKTASEKEQTAGLPNLGARLRKSWEPSVGLHTKVVMVCLIRYYQYLFAVS